MFKFYLFCTSVHAAKTRCLPRLQALNLGIPSLGRDPARAGELCHPSANFQKTLWRHASFEHRFDGTFRSCTTTRAALAELVRLRGPVAAITSNGTVRAGFFPAAFDRIYTDSAISAADSAAALVVVRGSLLWL